MRARLCGVFALAGVTALSAQVNAPVQYLSHAHATPVFTALGVPLPDARDWVRWISSADAATRARVAVGEELSIVNLLMFGTSFTSEPRLTSRQLNDTEIQKILSRRLDDFERALVKPDADVRLQLARPLVQAGPSPRARLLSMIDRALRDAATHARLTAEAQALGDPSLEFAERSRLYRDRGLAPDTSIRVNFALEQALRRLRGLTPVPVRGSDPGRPGGVRRVGIIGPGLDLVDKEEGYDFYPPQTIQPFALIDSLVRLGLADRATLQVTTFDVSASVNKHITDMRRQAGARTPYVLHLPLDGTVAWTPQLLSYFAAFGDAVGSPVPASVPPGIGSVKLRAVAVPSSIARRIEPRDLNITAQTMAMSEDERFDLVVGTNVFLYYDRLQQGLAMLSVSSMLRPGGVLLSNNALVEVPAIGMRSIGYSKTLYSNRPEDGDLIITYQKN